ncbi:MAG: type IV secretory system conjugative DNA transfer family protein [Clostridia bacterium]|nr:type IV secretory system conjugative DNA transfer family protein [Clostridia bacterium]
MDLSKIYEGYENAKLITYDEITASTPNTVALSDLEKSDVKGVLKCSKMIDGKLYCHFSGYDTHVGIIAPTGMGKSSSFINPMLKINAMRKQKVSMLITDPKGELYAARANDLRKNGYNVRLLNLRDYKHSDGYNILGNLYDKYHEVVDAPKRVKAVETEDGLKLEFDGQIFNSQAELDNVLDLYIKAGMNEVDNMVSEIVSFCIQGTGNEKDPFWLMSAQDVLRADIYAMLEDSNPATAMYDKPITRDSFTFRTMFTRPKSGDDLENFFGRRPKSCRSYEYASATIVNNAEVTKRGIIAEYSAYMDKFRDGSIQQITSFNSFSFDEFIEKPTAIFIIFKDEVSAHYEFISIFVMQLYAYLIETASKRKFHKLERPFYFMLDEFANMPKWDNFRRNISISASRNIFFVLALQSYSQLDSIYGQADATTIVQNLNYKVFMGSNDTKTIESFSKDCGYYTRISPSSALSGDGPELKNIHLETIPLLSVSRLRMFKSGECVVREVNSDCAMLSYMQRYFTCPELNDYEYCDEKEYKCSVNAYDARFIYDYSGLWQKKEPIGMRDAMLKYRQIINDYIERKGRFTLPMILRDCDADYSIARTCINSLLKNCTIKHIRTGVDAYECTKYGREERDFNQLGIEDFGVKPKSSGGVVAQYAGTIGFSNKRTGREANQDMISKTIDELARRKEEILRRMQMQLEKEEPDDDED